MQTPLGYAPLPQGTLPVTLTSQSEHGVEGVGLLVQGTLTLPAQLLRQLHGLQQLRARSRQVCRQIRGRRTRRGGTGTRLVR